MYNILVTKKAMVKRKEYMASGKKRKRLSWIVRGPLNYNLFFVILFLLIYGIVMVYSASYSSAVNLKLAPYHFMVNQMAYSVLGLAAMWIVSKIDYHIWMKLGWLGYIVSVIFVLLLKVPMFSYGALGAVRWLRFGPIRFQAAEPIKLFMMVFFSMYILHHVISGYFSSSFFSRRL